MVGVVLGDWSSGVVMLSDWLGLGVYKGGVLYVFLFTWLISSRSGKYLHATPNFFEA